MKKETQNYFILNVLILLLGIIVVIYSWRTDVDHVKVFNIVLGIYGMIHLLQFLMQKDRSDLESLYTMIACLITPLIQTVNFPKQNMALVFSLLTWISLMAIVKLVKLDYLHDRNDDFFKVKIMGFILFIVLGMITNYTLLFNAESQGTIIGFFLIINGIIVLGEDLSKNYVLKPVRVKNAKRK